MNLRHLKSRLAVGAAALAAASFAFAAPATAATTISNSGFFLEGAAGPYSGSFTTVCSTTAGNITGLPEWDVSGGSVDVIGGYWTPAVSGTNSLDMNGTDGSYQHGCTSGPGATSNPGTISQTLSTVANATYVVQFYLSGNPDNGPVTKELDVSATGTPEQTFSFVPGSGTYDHSNMQWQPEAYSFVATSDTTVVTFAGDPSNTTPWGPALDDPTITQTLPSGASCKDDGWKAMYDASGAFFKNQGACVSYFATLGVVPIGS